MRRLRGGTAAAVVLTCAMTVVRVLRGTTAGIPLLVEGGVRCAH
ncbi:hypothetical protein [Streptomyces sp. NPDC048481]